MSTRRHSSGLVVLAVDDEEHGLDEIKFVLESNSRVGNVLTAINAAHALEELRRNEKDTDEPAIDVVFIDVSMPGLSGMELARVVVNSPNAPSLVFITGHGETALEAFELGALDYLMKPVDEDRVDRALRTVERDKAASSSPDGQDGANQGDDEVIPVELAGTTKMVPRRKVRCVEAQGDYARLHTTDGASHLVRIPLAQLEERWADAGFVRIHRSFLVSLALVSELRMTSSGYSVVLGGGQPKELPVSRRHTRELKDRLVRPQRQSGWGPKS